MSAVDSVQIKEWARQLGFDLVGVAPAEPIAHADELRAYVARGYQGQMTYLSGSVETRIDPRKLLDGARSIICTATNYYHETPSGAARRAGGKVARYAWTRDYHDVIGARLKQLSNRIKEAVGGPVHLHWVVDSAPLAEKEHAARAGLGWIGKNGLLINEKFGSWLLLGEIVCDLELSYDEPVRQEKCGACTRCLEACPTGGLIKARVLDARRCVSYLTIEAKGQVGSELAERMGRWVFGCDVCQEVCPFNEQPTPTTDAAMQAEKRWCGLDPTELSTINVEQFRQRFAGSSIARTGVEHLQWVAQNCLKNQ